MARQIAPPDRRCSVMCPPRLDKPERQCANYARPGATTCALHAGMQPVTPIPSRRCTAHRSTDGEQCANWSLKGQTVCRYHGGNARHAKVAAQRRIAEAAVEAQARRTLAALGADPVDNPLVALSELAGEVMGFKNALAERVNELSSIRYTGDAGEQIRAEVLLYERAMDRAASVLGTIARLNIDERLAAISEKQAEAVVRAIDAALAHAGVTGPLATEAKQVAARRLRAVR
ncbi:hypothetical protein [Streptomyces triculaminicus]|uniref:hypothetical protein n=1 Tax=Streptomyces triculaminicus TaxID=2816232 RepID=UPI00379F872C